MRKSIFDIVSEKVDMKSDVIRIINMACEEKTLEWGGYKDHTLMDYVDKHCFREWKCRGHFVNVADFLNALDFKILKIDALNDEESMLILIELVYNFWQIACNNLSKPNKQTKWFGNFFHMRDVMNDMLNQYNHTAVYYEKEERVLVIEDKKEVTAVAEIVNDELSFDVIKYNHRTLRGELELKKAILINLGAELEPKRKELKTLNPKLEDNIFFMLNNLNIRHNNRSKKDKSKYKEYVAKMSKVRLEKWYDELYQMILLAFLLLDNVDRTENVKDLRDKINVTG